MKTLVINGSPRAEISGTLKITRAFLEGCAEILKFETEYLHLDGYTFSGCRGCFSCWERTPGQCILKDDMGPMRVKYIGSDLIVWSFPLYFFGVPSKMKAFIDRLLPNVYPDIIRNDDGTAFHPSRYDDSRQKHVIISSCGFFTTKNNYDALLKFFGLMFGKKGFEKILCPMGELFQTPLAEIPAKRYLSKVEDAGREFAENGRIGEGTRRELEKTMVEEELFINCANMSWHGNTKVELMKE